MRNLRFHIQRKSKLYKNYEQLQELIFKDSRIISLTNLSLFGTSEVRHFTRNVVYQNMELYYNPELDIEELSNRMEEILKDFNC